MALILLHCILYFLVPILYYIAYFCLSLPQIFVLSKNKPKFESTVESAIDVLAMFSFAIVFTLFGGGNVDLNDVKSLVGASPQFNHGNIVQTFTPKSKSKPK